MSNRFAFLICKCFLLFCFLLFLNVVRKLYICAKVVPNPVCAHREPAANKLVY